MHSDSLPEIDHKAADRLGGNEMRDCRLIKNKPVNLLLQNSISVRHSLMLTQVFLPGFDQERLHEPATVGRVFEHSPRIGAIPTTFTLQILNCQQKSVARCRTNAVF